MQKVTVVGAGHVGEHVGYFLAQRNLAHVVLIDIVDGMPQGKALDMSEASPLVGFDASLEGSNDLKAMKGSDVVVVTSGIPRKPGMDRMDLLKTNAGIVKDVAVTIKEQAPNAVVILVTNPLDVMAYVALKTTGFPRERVMGMAGVLDAARFRRFLAWEMKVSVKDVAAMVLGGHGDQMVPLPSSATVNGVPVTQLLSDEQIEKLVQRTRKGGGEIVALLKTGSAYYAPAASVAVMVEAILNDTGHLLPAAAFLQGEYGYEGMYMGVPVRLGKGGIRDIVQLELDEKEKAALDRSAEAVRKGVQDVSQFL